MTAFDRTIAVTADAKAAYAALTTGFKYWWTNPEGTIQQVGDHAKFGFPPGVSYWTFEAVKLVPGKYVELLCIEASHKHKGQPKEIETEWLGTRVIWSIEDAGGTTTITMRHVGLTPDLLCFDICVAGWDHFYTDSLKAYLNSGVGTPHRSNS